MFKLSRISLGVLIPLAALILLVLAQGGMVFYEFSQAKVRLVNQQQDHLEHVGYRLQQNLADLLSRHSWHLAERQLSLISLNQNLERLQLIDEQGLVQLSNIRSEKNLFAVDLYPHFSHTDLSLAKTTMLPVITGTDEQWQVNLYFPLDMGPREDSLSRTEVGGIYMSYNLINDWKMVKQQIVEQSIQQFVLMSLAMLALILLLNKSLVKPLNRLVRRTQQVQSSPKLEFTAKGQGEIGELERAILKMADSIHGSFVKLQHSEQRWQFALTGSGDGIMDWDLLGNSVYYSPQWAEMLGLEHEGLSALIDEWEDRIHPEDQDKTLSALRQHLKKKTDHFESMHRIRHNNGSYLWVLSRGMVVERSDKGLPSRLISTQTNMSEMRSAQEMLRFQSAHDDITRLPNRRKLLDNLDNEIERFKLHNLSGALIYLDVDHFKNINDMLGHAAGDLLLRLIAHRLREGRKRNETVARLGGDEFALLVPEIDKDPQRAIDKACSIAEDLRQIIHKEFVIKGNQIALNLTIGVAVFPNHDSNAIEILRQAEIALYHGKDEGRASIRVFSTQMADKIKERHQLQQLMRKALEQDDMVAYFQPRYNAAYEMVGAETLIRWFDSELGWVSPGRFIPLAEESGLIISIGQFVLKSACDTLYSWQEQGLPENFKTLSINVSPNQFHRDHFVDETLEIIRQSGCDPQLLELEITEGVLVDNVDETVAKIQRLRDIGVRFSVDDFGTGYSSLAYLNKLPINCLKIDKSFVSEVQSGGSECAIITTIISMAENLNLEVIAEGVETEYQLEFLKYRRCTVYQGFFFSEALEPEIFKQRLFGL